MNITLWVLQGLLALVFLMAGLMKATQSREKLASQMGWVEDFSQGQIRAIGILEVLGALGLLLPALTGILPTLTPLAAAGLSLTMVGAFLAHLRRENETQKMIGNVVLFALALFVAYGRFVLFPL